LHDVLVLAPLSVAMAVAVGAEGLAGGELLVLMRCATSSSPLTGTALLSTLISVAAITPSGPEAGSNC
jgi:hypothetical protein